MRVLPVMLCSLMTVIQPVYTFAENATEIAIDGVLDEHLKTVCNKYPALPYETCSAIVTAGARSVAGLDVDYEALKSEIKNPVFLNSLLTKEYGGNIPLGLEFKTLDSEQGENVLALSYTIKYNVLEHNRTDDKKWNERTELAFQASGTITNEAQKNPRNFLDSKISFSNTYTSKIPVQDLEFGTKLTDASAKAGMLCSGDGNAQKQACIDARKKALDLLSSTSDFLDSFQRYEIGLDGGYETDQTFDAKQSKFSGFISGQYENWDKNSFLGGLGIIPAFRLAADKLDPNEETPRALAGDDSSYYRVSSELSFWMPIGTHFDKRLAIAFNYRNYTELNPSTVVENAGLDSYNLRTFSITAPSGIFISYSSGELPLDQQSDEVLALGWQTYF